MASPVAYRPLSNEEEYPKEKDENVHSTTPLAHFGSSLDDSDIKSDLINKIIPDKSLEDTEDSEGEDDMLKSTTISAAAPAFRIARIVLTILIFLIVGSLIAGSIILIITTPPCPPPLTWWQTTVIYQIYPQSFQYTGSGDNTTVAYGDLNGIKSHLDYLDKTLGVDAVWINPIYASPMVDNGYDISDYYSINPRFGTMQDFDALLGALHDHDIKLIMDFVPNHTSDKHQWFLNCVEQNISEYCDYYVWREGNSNGGPPNNWLSVLNGSAWTYSNTTQKYYLHQFYPQQPDLNYRNKKVKEEMKEVLKFWLEKGVDGFRVDAVAFLLEDNQFRNEPINPDFNGSNESDYNSLEHIYTTNVLGVHAVVQEWRKVLDCYSEPDQEKVFIGELYGDVHTVVDYYGKKKKEFDFPYNFIFIGIEEWNANTVREAVNKWWYAMPEGAWPNWVLGNHDNPRIATRAGPDLVRALSLLLLTLPGTPTAYYGDEIGMTNLVDLPENYDERDAERTPMQWDTSLNAGFSNITPWIPVVPNYNTTNVQVQNANNQSTLKLFHQLADLRSHNEALKYSRYTPLNTSDNIFAFKRDKKHADNVAIILINFDNSAVTEDLSASSDVPKGREFYVAVSTFLNRTETVDMSKVQLGPHEGIVLIGK